MLGSLTGPAMMLKSLGIDPKQIEAKGRELEALAKTTFAFVASKVDAIEKRQERIENMLTILLNNSAVVQGNVIPAGEIIRITEEI